MRQTIAGLIAAVAAMSAAPAMACGGLFTGCSPCGGQEYVSPCEQAYVAPPVYVSPGYNTGCNSCGGGWAHERLADPERQYYYVNQGPTYSGPGNFAPYPSYEEGALPTYGHHSYYRSWRHGYRHMGYPSGGYGYYPHHNMRYGMMHRGYGYGYGYRGRSLRRYY